MCIIIAADSPEKITKELLERCWDRNHHGGGFAYVNNERMVVVKQLQKFSKFWKLFDRHRRVALQMESPMLIHFRIATHGTVSLQNVHPFFVAKDTVMAHNGTFRIQNKGDWSDTRTFAELVLKFMPEDFVSNTASLWLIKKFADASRVVFLSVDKKFRILNKQSGERSDEFNAWFSNSGYKEPPKETRIVRTGTTAFSSKQDINALRGQKCFFCNCPVCLGSAYTAAWLYNDGSVACSDCGDQVRDYYQQKQEAERKKLEDTQEIPIPAEQAA